MKYEEDAELFLTITEKQKEMSVPYKRIRFYLN